MRTCFRHARDLASIDAARQQGIRDQRSVTSPGHGFRAHQRDSFSGGQRDTAIQVRFELRRLHVVRVAAEAGIPPSGVDRVFPRAAQSAEPWHVRVVNACVLERCGQLLAAELRVVARLRNLSDVDETLHAVRGQQGDEFIDGPRRVTDSENRHDGPDQARITRPSLSNIRWVSVRRFGEN